MPSIKLDLAIYSGDSEDPMEECRNFVLQLIHQQLRSMISKAMELVNVRGRQSISYAEILFLFRRHPMMVKRLIDYTRLLETVPSFHLHSFQPGTDAGEVGGEHLAMPEHDNEKLRRTGVVMAALKASFLIWPLVYFFSYVIHFRRSM